MLQKVSTRIREGTTTKAYNLQKRFSIEFASQEAISTFVDTLESDPSHWVDPKTNSSHVLRTRYNRSAESREMGLLLSSLYTRLKLHLEKSGRRRRRLGMLHCEGLPGIRAQRD